MYRKIPEILETIEETLKSIFYKIIFKNSYYTKKNAGTAPALILRKINGAVLAIFFVSDGFLSIFIQKWTL